jgi:hypothetical protein
MAPAVQRQEPPYLQLLAAEQIIEGTAGYIRQVTGREAVRRWSTRDYSFT